MLDNRAQKQASRVPEKHLICCKKKPKLKIYELKGNYLLFHIIVNCCRTSVDMIKGNASQDFL